MLSEFDALLERLDELYRKMEPVDQLVSLEFVCGMIQEWRLNAFGGSPLNDRNEIAMERDCNTDRLTLKL